jgi:putative tricarboxylic transport membrane protein
MVAAAVLALALPAAAALESLRIVIPDAPGSPLDSAGRELGEALVASGAVKNLQYENMAGADGTIALTQFAERSKGDPNAILLGSSEIAQGIARNASTVTFEDVTPVATISSGPDGNWRRVFAAPGITKARRDELAVAIEKAMRRQVR